LRSFKGVSTVPVGTLITEWPARIGRCVSTHIHSDGCYPQEILSLPAQSSRQPDPTLGEIIAQRQEQLARKDQAPALAEVKIMVLEERLWSDRISRYGKRSETLSDLQLQLLGLGPGVSSEEVEAESEREPLQAQMQQDKSPSKPRHKHPGQQELPSHLAPIHRACFCSGVPWAIGAVINRRY
jgi:Transposase C of IS166 homeodomain